MPHTESGIGFRNRDTSQDAAHALDKSASTLRAMVLSTIRQSGRTGMTADEAATAMGLSVLSTRPRFTELSKAGQIEDTGTRRFNASGRRAAVWVAK